MKAGLQQTAISAALRGRERLGPERQARLIEAMEALGLAEPVIPDESEPVFEIPVRTTSE